MSCGILQLATTGEQDIYLTGNPQITFYKTVYRRYTNFSVQTLEYPLAGDTNFGGVCYLKFSKDADLINKLYLKIVLDQVDPNLSNFAWVRRVGHAIIDLAEITIGGAVIDRQTGVWLDVWYELTHNNNLQRGYEHLIGDVPELTDYNNSIKPEYCLYVPLQFWFNKFIGLSIPVIALQYHDVVLNLNLAKASKLAIRDSNFDMNLLKINNASVLADYVYLDTEERKKFASISHEYLITQLQINGPNLIDNIINKFKLDFNFPTKEIIWVIRQNKYFCNNKFVYYSNSNYCVKQAAYNILIKSIADIDPSNTVGGDWCVIPANTSVVISKLSVTNMTSCSIWVNPTSLAISDKNNLTQKISADICVSINCSNNKLNIDISNIETSLTLEDISTPTNLMIDHRYMPDDPIVNMFNNYGVLIDGGKNPVLYGKIIFNGMDRFSKREGDYLKIIQADEHHSNVPDANINLYSFALHPEEHQPSGASNLSRVDTSELQIWLDNSNNNNSQDTANKSTLFIFGTNTNIFRIGSGISGLAYQ